MGNEDVYIERLQSCAKGAAKKLAPSFRNIPLRLSKPGALDGFMFLRISFTLFSVVGVKLILVFYSRRK